MPRTPLGTTEGFPVHTVKRGRPGLQREVALMFITRERDSANCSYFQEVWREEKFAFFLLDNVLLQSVLQFLR